MEQPSNRLLHQTDQPHPQTKYERLIHGTEDQRFAFQSPTPTQAQKISDHYHLGQDCGLDQGKPVLCVLEIVFSQNQAAIPDQRDQKKAMYPKIIQYSITSWATFCS